MHPYVASSAMRFDQAITLMPDYMNRTIEVYEILKNIPGITFCPDPPQVNMFHLYFNASAERLTEARNQIAKEDKIWIANRFQPTTLQNLSYTEIYVGDGLLKVENEDLINVFVKLIELAK